MLSAVAPAVLALAGAAPASWVGLEPGPHAVGFRTGGLDAVGRPCAGDAACAFRVFEWYPATESAAPPLRFADYAADAGPVDAVERRAARLRRLMRLARPTGAPDLGPLALLPEGVERALDETAFAARRDAPRASARFPAVVLSLPRYAPGPQLPLVEALASDGHVVLGIRPEGLAPPPPWQLGEGAAVAAMEGEARAVERLLDHALASDAVDPARIALLCWSRGGGAAALVQTRRAEVRALVSLDSIVNDESGLALIRQAPGFDPGAIDVPWVFMTGGRPRLDLSLYDEARRAPRHLLRFPRLSHANFTYTGGALQEVIGLPAEASEWGVTGPLAARGYRAIATAARAFLPALLAGEALDPAVLDAEPGFAELSSRPAEPGPPPERVWADRFAEAALPDECARVPERCTPDALLSLADRLRDAGRARTAARVLERAVQRHPGEAALHASRAEVLATLGERAEARRAAERALALDPGQEAARGVLSWLEARAEP